jgi:RsiW-degrading membrane proteinase PrsW (M82 family)
MPEVSCSCGRRFDAPPGDAICPDCGSITPVAEERIRVKCACGAAIAAPARLAGKRVKCPKCAQPVLIPAPEPEIDFAAASEPVPDAAPLPPSPRAGAKRRETAPLPPPPVNDGWKKFARWGLALALAPLILSVFTPDDKPFERLKRMIERDPSLAKSIEHISSRKEMFAALPNHQIDGAFLPSDAWTHWLYALLSAGAFWGIILFLFPLGRATSKQIWFAGLFVGTIGILLLLGLQYVALWTQGTWVRGGNILVVLFYILKFIGYSYRAALDPSNGFILSMLGFTFGVGFCEELCKALPLLWQFRKAGPGTLDVRGAVVWGLAAGVGFGVSEGITYSSDHYNGVSTGGIYVVRFVSCVALHAVWSATNALFLWKRQTDIESIGGLFDWIVPLFITLGSSMVLHGLYDTMLKREMEIGALVTAVASFALFFWLYERVVSDEVEAAPAVA